MIQPTLVLKIREDLINDVIENYLRENQITKYLKIKLSSIQTRSTGQSEINFESVES